MDNYIYYRILKCLKTQGKTLRSDLFFLVGMSHKQDNPIDLLWERGFIKDLTDELYIFDHTKVVTYYEITDSGLKLYKKMEQFYKLYDQLLKDLHTRMKIGDHTREKIISLHKNKY